MQIFARRNPITAKDRLSLPATDLHGKLFNRRFRHAKANPLGMAPGFMEAASAAAPVGALTGNEGRAGRN